MMFDDTTNTDGVTPEGVEEGGKCGGEGEKCNGEGEKKKVRIVVETVKVQELLPRSMFGSSSMLKIRYIL